MLEKMKKSDFPIVYNIMEQSFPRDECRPYDEQPALMNLPEYQIYIARDAVTTAIKAFLAIWDFEEFVFIEHFAVAPEFRNTGLGLKMLGEIVARFAKPICLEVEPPEDSLTCRRIAFYQRNGFFLNDYPYMQPPIAEGRNAIPLMIMTYGSTVSEAEFETIKRVLYTRVYHTDAE